MDDDNDETNQSRNIRLKLDKVPSKASVATTNTTDSEASVYFRPECILSPSLFPNVPPYLNFTSHADKGPPMPPTLHRVLKWKLSPVMPKIVKRVVLNSGFRIIKSEFQFHHHHHHHHIVSHAFRYNRLDGCVGEAHEKSRFPYDSIASEI